MESGYYLLGMTKLVIGITSLIGGFHNELNSPGLSHLLYLG